MARAIALSLFCWLVSLSAAHALDVERTFDPALGELPESIAIDEDGNIFLSMSDTIRVIDTDGNISTFGTLPLPIFALGVKVGPDGCVYTASTSLDPTVAGAFVWRICEAGVVEQFAELDPASGANDLAFDDDGYLYVTDTFLGQIYRVSPFGEAEVWFSDPLLQGDPANPALLFHDFGVNGIAFDKHKRYLYVGNLDMGEILRIPFCNGSVAGPIQVFASDPLLVGADGIAFDKRGNLYVTVNAANRLVSISKWGTISVVAEGAPLDSPSSVAFGTQPGDRHTLYVTSSAVSIAFGILPGVPMPALVSTWRAHRGLPLP